VDAKFWLDRWQRNQTGFDEPHVNPLLLTHFASLSLPAGSRIFVPLCGKTLDIRWLLSRGHQVAGAELSVTPSVTTSGPITRYSAAGIEVFQGDVFALCRGDLGPVDAVYDRAALIALPDSMRADYSSHVERLTQHARQLLICLKYDQRLLAGPPFSVDGEELARLYRPAYKLELLGSAQVVGGLKGKCPAAEEVWMLTP
jgi:thiopurine S-methyltransferase